MFEKLFMYFHAFCLYLHSHKHDLFLEIKLFFSQNMSMALIKKHIL